MLPARLAHLAVRCALLLAAAQPLRPAVAQATAPGLADARGCAVLWQVTPVLDSADGTAPHLRLALRFNGGRRNQTALHLPGGWAGLSELADANGPRLRALPGEPAWRQLAHTPGETVQLQWRLQPGSDASQGGHTQLMPGWFAFSGQGVLPMPEGADEPGAGPACVALTGLPAGSRWASSHGTADGPAALFVLPQSGVPLAQRVQQALYAGGALQWQAAPGVVAVLPAAAPWPLDAGAVARAGARALAAQQRQWPQPAGRDAPPVPASNPTNSAATNMATNAATNTATSAGTSAGPNAAANPGTRATPPWLLLVLPAQAAAPQDGALASAWHQALALQLPPAWAGGELDVERLLTPALARAWMAERFGPLAHAGRGDAPLRTWFSAGWADFLAHRSLLREGLWTPEDYAAALNTRIAAYLAEPARALPNAELAANSTLSPQLARLQAWRGEWLALQWHLALRRAGQPGLDAVLRQQLVPAAQARREGPISAPLATHRLVATLRAVLHDQALRDLQLHIDQGRPFDFRPDSLGPCFTPAMPADRSAPPAYRAVPAALQQADCQGWLGLGPLAEMATAAPQPRADATAGVAGCKPARQGGRQAGARARARCSSQAAAAAGSAPGATASAKAGAKPGTKAGAKSAGKPVARATTKPAAKAGKPTPPKAGKPAR